MARVLVSEEQEAVTRYHAGTAPRPPRNYQRPILSAAQAGRLVEVELLRAVMASAPAGR